MVVHDLLTIILVGFGLSADCFAVSLSVGAATISFSPKNMLRIAIAFGCFQMAMPVVGWLIGQTIVGLISRYDHWVAFAMLAFIGGKMMAEFIRNSSGSDVADVNKISTLIILAIATSIDALAVGLSFALLRISIFVASLIIGVIAFSVSAFSFWLGRKVSVLIGKWALLGGGIILIGIGIRILLTHIYV